MGVTKIVIKNILIYFQLYLEKRQVV